MVQHGISLINLKLMKYQKTIMGIFFLLLALGCKLTFSPVLNTVIKIQTNVTVREKDHDTIKKQSGILKTLKKKSHDKDFK